VLGWKVFYEQPAVVLFSTQLIQIFMPAEMNERAFVKTKVLKMWANLNRT